MALAQYRSRRDAERSCPWFDYDGDDSMTRLPAIAEQAYDEEATASTTERAPRDEDPLVEPALLRRYEICARVGGTSRCVVYKAYERARRRFVALKLLQDCFRDRTSAQRCYREVAYLHALQGHPCVGRLRRVYVGESGLHAAIALDYFGTDLRHAILSDRLSPEHRTCVARQLFAALAFVHDAKIAHRDVRPSNIVLDEKCHAQLIDFSSAKFLGSDDSTSAALDGLRSTTDDIGARCYQPPEQLLGSPRRGGRAGDVWACGCILVEMETSIPLFAGKNTLDVLTRQCWVLGAPSPSELRQLHCSTDADRVVAHAASRAALLNRAPSILELIDDAFSLRESLKTSEVKQDSNVDASVLKKDARRLELREETRRGDVSDLALACVSSLDPRLSPHDALRHPLFAAFTERLPAFEDSKDGLFSLLERHCGDGLDAGGARLPPSEYRARIQSYVHIDEVSIQKCRPPHLRTQIRIQSDDDDTSYASSSHGHTTVSWADLSAVSQASPVSDGTYSYYTPEPGSPVRALPASPTSPSTDSDVSARE